MRHGGCRTGCQITSPSFRRGDLLPGVAEQLGEDLLGVLAELRRRAADAARRLAAGAPACRRPAWCRSAGGRSRRCSWLACTCGSLGSSSTLLTWQKMKSPPARRMLHPLGARLGGEDLVEDLDRGAGVGGARAQVGEALVGGQLGAAEGAAEVGPVAVGLQHAEADPACRRRSGSGSTADCLRTCAACAGWRSPS